MKEKLGKIKSVKFGHCGYQDAFIGIDFELGGDGWGVCTTEGTWDPCMVKHSAQCEWTEESRREQFVDIIVFISELLKKAKVSDIGKLHNIPIKAIFNNGVLQEWSVLEEVL